MPEVRALRARVDPLHTHWWRKQGTPGVRPDDPDLLNMKRDWERGRQELTELRNKLRSQIAPKYPVSAEVRAILGGEIPPQNFREYVEQYIRLLRYEEDQLLMTLGQASATRIREREHSDDIDLLLELRKRLKQRLLQAQFGNLDLSGSGGTAQSEVEKLRREVEELRAEVKRLREAKQP